MTVLATCYTCGSRVLTLLWLVNSPRLSINQCRKRIRETKGVYVLEPGNNLLPNDNDTLCQSTSYYVTHYPPCGPLLISGTFQNKPS